MENESSNELVKTKKKPLKIISDLIYFTILITLVLCIMLVLFNSVIGDGQKRMAFFGYTPTIIVTGSMLPTIQINSLCWMKNTDIEEIEVGDIIVYNNPEDGRNIVHRVIEIDDSNGITFTMKGDNNPTRDKFFVTEAMYKAKIVSIWNWSAKYVGNCIEDCSINYTKLASYVAKGLAIMFAFIYVFYIVIYLIVRWAIIDNVKKHRRKNNGLQQ